MFGFSHVVPEYMKTFFQFYLSQITPDNSRYHTTKIQKNSNRPENVHFVVLGAPENVLFSLFIDEFLSLLLFLQL